jgi:hypothetical protein
VVTAEDRAFDGEDEQPSVDAEEATWQDRIDFPRPPHEAAYYGLPGEVARSLHRFTEGCAAAILAQNLAAFGSAVGRGPYYEVGADQQRANVFVAVTGASGSGGRKGSALGPGLAPLRVADPEWAQKCLGWGLATGQGLIHRLRDPVRGRKGDVIDEGVSDKRFLAIETEFSRPLRLAAAPENILTVVLRQGWDGLPLETLAKTCPERATDTHLSVIGHTTPTDLRRFLTEADVHNGFSNRFLWVAARRARSLPDGGALPADLVNSLGRRTAEALTQARRVGAMKATDGARELWRDVYEKLVKRPPGALGAVTSRAESNVRRLSLIYALTDGSSVIGRAHLGAALAMWDYCERSARWIFGWSTGDHLADRLLGELRAVYPDELSRAKLAGVLSRHHSVDAPLRHLEELDLAECHEGECAGGRPPQLWRANPHPPVEGLLSLFCMTSLPRRPCSQPKTGWGKAQEVSGESIGVCKEAQEVPRQRLVLGEPPPGPDDALDRAVDLVAAELAARKGAGKKNDPYRHWRASAAGADAPPEERQKDRKNSVPGSRPIGERNGMDDEERW